jgi:hypothetical protein
MKLEEKHNSIEEQLLQEDNTPHHRWMWVRRFVLSIILVTLFMQTFYFEKEDQDMFISTAAVTKSNNKARIILHTGFPPPDNISGLSIVPGKAAATAFSPNPTSFKEIKMDRATSNGEGWWDRLFPNRHVHLVSVQLPVVSTNHSVVQGTLSICASKRERFGLGKPQIPDLNKCVNTVSVKTDDVDPDDNFGVLEWNPEATIVLKKSKMYWLVVQADSEPFSWIYAQGGSNQYGTAFETEAGWEFKLEGEPIPSAMVMVEDHPKD